MKKDDFKNPGAVFRGKPFWAWNGKLEEKELRRQLRVMKEMGLGGAFMHSRVGLDTEYLSEEWFKLINACADECRKNSMEAWLYDEDRWPSGAAGGIVTKNPKYRMSHLQIKIFEPKNYKAEKGEIGAFLGKLKNSELSGYRKFSKAIKPESDEKIISFTVKTNENSSWYNGFTYLDTMSADAVEKFIEVTHKAYAKKCGKEFAKTIPGIFTDEPNYGQLFANENFINLPWTITLPKQFKKEYGYDLLEKLPELAFRTGNEDFSKARHDYFEMCTYLFVRNFGKKIYERCEKDKLLFTGHVLSEARLASQTKVVGSAMRFYEYMQAPGIDILCAEGLTRESNAPPEYLTAKQCSSMLDQMGRKWMLSELYGCTGWHFTLAEHKAVGDWQAALGVNLRCQHLSWYTMEGEAKRDYPASIFFHSPWWKNYSLVEDYFSRLNYMLTQGRPVRDVAMIHPIESAWGIAYLHMEKSNQSWRSFPQNDDEKKESLKKLDQRLVDIQQMLLEEHYDFEYVDEDILSRYGSLGNGRFKVGHSSYSTVLVPPSITLRKNTCDMLAKFANAGGNVVFIEPVPSYMEAEKSDEIDNLIKKCTKINLDKDALVNLLSKDKTIRRVSVTTPDGKTYPHCLYMMRKDKNGRVIVFVCHTLQDNDADELFIDIACAGGQVQEWDAATGTVYLAESQKTSSGVCVKTSLPGYGSRLFIIDPKEDKKLVSRPIMKEIKRQKIDCGAMKIFRDEPNAFPLDMPQLSIDGGEWQEATEILSVDDIIRDKLGIQRRGGQMVQPWAQKKEKSSKKLPISLRYVFDVREIPSSPCHLVMERPEKFSISLNGHELKYDESEGWWIDLSFKKIRVPTKILREGSNEIILNTDYSGKDNLEAMYFTGEFGFCWKKNADGKIIPTINSLPATLKTGDWCEQGFPCYSGAISYSLNVRLEDLTKKIFVEIPDWKGALLKVYVNNKEAGSIVWKPYEIEISGLLKKGDNTIQIEVVGTRRNILGPLHLEEKYPQWTGPSEFRKSKVSEYIRLPYGLMSAPYLLEK